MIDGRGHGDQTGAEEDRGHTPSASVVIPTYNRLEELSRVVTAVRGQQLPDGGRAEVVVVDDGSTDGTWEWLCSQVRDTGLEALRQDNAGPARARNRGAAAAAGEVVLFLGDDTVPEPRWLLTHLEEHRIFGGDGVVAVLGYTSFPSRWDSPFLRYINEYGAQFGYRLIDRPSEVPFNFFYTSNVSLPRRVLIDLGGFREDFPAAAWEDIEFAYRADAQGLRIRYQPRARAVHNHRMRPRTFCRRQETSGHSAAIFAGIHPELGDFLGVDRARSLQPGAGVLVTALARLVDCADRLSIAVPTRLYHRMLDLSYLRGLAGGLQEGAAEVPHADRPLVSADRAPGHGRAGGVYRRRG